MIAQILVLILAFFVALYLGYVNLEIRKTRRLYRR